VAYEIRYLKREVAVGTESWNGSLQDARGLAQSAVNSGEYDAAEVHGPDGRLFRWPRTVRAVPGSS
jgi:hypothetical protein